jgi:protein-tyrosine-phosphatase
MLQAAVLANATLRTADIGIRSAGTGATLGAPATPLAVDTMKRRGIVLEGHKATPLSKNLVETADLVLTMTSSHKSSVLRGSPEAAGKVFTIAEYAGGHGDVADPLTVGTSEAYERCATQLASMIPGVLERLRNLVGPRAGSQ